MRSCPSADDLQRFLDQPPAAPDLVSEHLAECAACRRVLDELTDRPKLRAGLDLTEAVDEDLPGYDSGRLRARLIEALRNERAGRDEIQPAPLGDGASLFDPAQSADAAWIGPYRVLGELGRGGMGLVVKALDPALERLVAIKILHSAQVDEADKDRFRREARTIASIRHDNIVQVHGVVERPGRPHCLVMEYIEGPTLRERIAAERRLGAHEAATISTQVAEGLEAAHREGVVHRDIKPSNIILDRASGRARIVDFGLARGSQRTRTITVDGAAAGTPEYMSPEQLFAPDRVDGRSDIYALGVTLYEALTGECPFRGTPAMIVKHIQEDDPVPPRRLNDLVPRDLETICLKCLAKEPWRRYASADELARDLRRFLSHEPIRARRSRWWETGWRPAWRYLRRHAVISAAAAVLAAGAVAGLAWRDSSLQSANNRRLKSEHNQTLAALERATVTQARLTSAVRREEKVGYYYRIGLAHVELEAGNAPRAAALLSECPPHSRAWEWFYLHGLCHAERMIVAGTPHGLSGVAYSPDGHYLVAAGADGLVRVYDAATGRALRDLVGHKGSVRCVAVGPKGMVATGGRDRSVRAWDAASGRSVFVRAAAHDDVVTSVAVSPDGRRIVSAGADRAIRIWDAGGSDHPLAVIPNASVVSSVAFSFDGTRVVCGDYDGAVTVRDAATGAPVVTARGHTTAVQAVAISPDDRLLASAGSDDSLRTWGAQDGQPIRAFRGHGGQVNALAISPDNQHLAAAGLDRAIRIWDLKTGVLSRAFRGHSQLVWGLAFSPDGKRLASAGRDGAVHVWDTDASPQAVIVIDRASRVTQAAFAGERGRFVSLGDDGSVVVSDTRTGQELARVDWAGADVSAVAFHPDGRVVVLGVKDGPVRLWDLESKRVIGSLAGHSGRVNCLVFSRDGRQLASGGADGTVRVWDVATREPVFEERAHPNGATTLAFSPDGKRLASAGPYNQRVHVWDLTARRRAYRLPAPAGHTTAIAFSPGGEYLASADTDGTVVLWDAGSTREVRSFRAHAQAVHGLAFSADGRRIVSAGWDRVIRIWDVETGQEVLALRGHRDVINALEFSGGSLTDGGQIASASDDRTVRIWRASRSGDLGP